MAASIVSKELAVRVAILDVAPTGSLLVKAESPGRLYDAITPADLAAQLSALLPANVVVNGVVKARSVFTLTQTDLSNGFVTVDHPIILNSELVVWNSIVLDSDPISSSDYYISNNQIVFRADLLSTLLVDDRILVRYEYVV